MKIRNVALTCRHTATPKPIGVASLINSAGPQPGRFLSPLRLGSLIVLLALLVGAFLAAPAVSSLAQAARQQVSQPKLTTQAAPDKQARQPKPGLARLGLAAREATLIFSGLTAPAVFSESIATFASDCSTPKTAFNVGETVCARVAGAAGRRLNWVDPSGLVRRSIDIVADPQNDTFTIPGATVLDRGSWRLVTLDAETAIRAGAFFTVRDPAQATVDLVSHKSLSVVDSDATAGGNIITKLWLTNLGPDTAQNVVVTDTVPANTTFVSATQDSGPAFACSTPALGGSGTTTCTIASLAKDATALFTVVYQITSTASGIINTASISSSTNERDNTDNAANSTIIETPGSGGGGGGGGSCTITCPANLTQNNDPNQAGAIVNFPPPTTSGSCGTVTSDPPSGSFFPIGATTVTSLDEGGSSCTFTVTIIDTRPLTLTVNGANPLTVECHTSFTDPGATPSNSSATVTTSGTVNVNTPGSYTLTYTATDGTNTATATRTVSVVDTTDPTITLTGMEALTVECHSAFTDPGATASDTCAGNLTSMIAVAGEVNVDVPGTYTLTYSVADGSGNTAAVERTVNVVDTAPPTVTAPPALPVMTGAGNTLCGVVVSDATLGTATANDACSGSLAITRTGVPAGNFFPVGTTTITYKAIDASGNMGTATQTVTVLDNTPPVPVCPANLTVNLPPNSTATSMAVSYPAATATDNCSSPTIAYSKGSGSIFNVGSTTVTVTATDGAGNTSTCSFTVTVLYSFTGFFQPISNLPTLNEVNAGRSIPVKFSLSGDKGLNILAPGYPASGVIVCSSADPVVNVTETSTAGSSSLSYNAGADQYHYVWKTESSWAGTCRQLVIRLNDGSEYRANFKFK